MANGERRADVAEGKALVMEGRFGFDVANFRKRFREALGSRGESEAGEFRQIRVTEGATGPESGICLALPGGLRVEGLDIEAAAELVRRLS